MRLSDPKRLAFLLSTVAMERSVVMEALGFTKEQLRCAMLGARKMGYRVVLRHVNDGEGMRYYLYTDERSMQRAAAMKAQVGLVPKRRKHRRVHRKKRRRKKR